MKFAWKISGAAMTAAMALASASFAANFDIPGGSLKSALNAYAAQTGIPLIYLDQDLDATRSKGVKGDLSNYDALARILAGTGFAAQRHSSGSVGIVRATPTSDEAPLLKAAAATAPTVSGAALETVTVTSSKIGGDVQNIPISITALSQEQLTATQTNGGPDLIKQVPNMTFTKTNFSGYSIQLRGIGTQAISVTTDPAVAVAFNDIPFIRNHFFEQEFYDVSSVQVLRGPQGTLYGRNATAGVVNLESAKPTDQFEAMASVEVGNYGDRRPEGMINIPVVDDRLDIRIAGEWTKRQGYSFDETTDARIDGRDLWSGRLTIGLKPTENVQMYLVWEHFSEDDDRIRSAKQLCKTDQGPGEVDGVPFPVGPGVASSTNEGNYLTQGCLPTSFYSPDAYEAPLGFALPYVTPLQTLGNLATDINPYASTTQSTNLRVIDSQLSPIYKAKNDVAELNADWKLSPSLTFTSQTGFGHDFLYSAEDYNRFGAAQGFFNPQAGSADIIGLSTGSFCDPQLGCSSGLLAEDLSQEHAWQLSQEFRLTSNFSGPLNFSFGGNYLHYETEENYYVFINTITLLLDAGAADANHPWIPGVSDNAFALRNGLQFNDPTKPVQPGIINASYIDPNPISNLNNNGHNYFLSQNPYVLNSYATFGEVYYNIFTDLKLTAGLRWTEDQKHFSLIPSWFAAYGWGYPIVGVINQQWGQLTGRAVANWTPKLDFTDQTLIYGSYSHGYKAGGANPPGALFFVNSAADQPTHPLTFKPEFIDAFETGTKNTLLDGALTLNADVFYYNYENYQISEIVDRTAINLNFDAHAEGAELEATWEPMAGLRFNFSGGWEDTAIAKGQTAVDLMDRTAGTPGWYVKKPYVTEASNCIFPTDVILLAQSGGPTGGTQTDSYCLIAYHDHADPLTGLPYVRNPSVMCDDKTDFGNPNCVTVPVTSDLANYPGFDPASAPNDGTGFSKNLGGNKLPNAPPFTVSFGAQYTMPLSTDWAGTLREDFYYQASSYWREFNDLPFDRLHGYTNLNLTLIFTNQNGWQVMLFDKNVFNTTAITGAFLNSDDSGLTTNVFLTDPKLIGVRVTKNW